MKSDDQILESLIAGGLIGSALGALISKDKEEGATLGAIAGAAILATFQASEQAKENNLAVLAEENGKLFEFLPNGEKRFVKDLHKPVNLTQKNFKLE